MPPLPNLESLIRSRGARLGLALFFIALSAWAFVPYIAYRIAPSAFINAELTRVTAPIAGRLTQDLPRKGEFITKPEKVTLIQFDSPNRRHLLDLEHQYAIAKKTPSSRAHSSRKYRWLTPSSKNGLRLIESGWSTVSAMKSTRPMPKGSAV